MHNYDVIKGLWLLLEYTLIVIGLSAVCALFVEHFYPEPDNHKKHKITHITLRSRK